MRSALDLLDWVKVQRSPSGQITSFTEGDTTYTLSYNREGVLVSICYFNGYITFTDEGVVFRRVVNDESYLVGNVG